MKRTRCLEATPIIKISDNRDLFSDDPLEKQYVYVQAQYPSRLLEKVVMVSFQSGYVLCKQTKPCTHLLVKVPGNAYTFQKGVQQYAVLQAHFPQKLLEKQVLLTFQTGHIFIQTDKTIYTPDSTGMSQAVESGVRVEILTPDGISLQSKSVYPDGGMTSGTFSVTDPASSGMWKLVAWHQGSPQQNFSSEFEVKEYVLPSFEISLTPHKSFFHINDYSLSVIIESKYLFGKKVNGHAFVVFGVITEDKGKISLPGSLQRIRDGSGRAELKRKHILETFPKINQIVGHSLFVSVSVLTETDMVPSFRFVTYYHVGSNEGVSDSVWVDVKDTLMGSLKVEVRDPLNIYAPDEKFGLKLTRDPGAKVGLVAVDKGVYVLNNNRLTQSKIWDVVEKQDTGCTAGSGREDMQVFSDAGLLFESSTAGGTGVRTMNEYSGLKRECCVDGMRQIDGYSCLYRSKFIVDGQECEQAFLYCEMEEFVNSDSIVTRTLFPESWLWEEGNVRGKDTQSSMTAFVLIALQEGRSICSARVPSLENSIRKATTFLNSQLHNGSHWPVPGSIYFSLEATAYALLAFVKAKDFQRAAPIVTWLNNQRQYNGGYGTTQATIMVFQAVAEYRIQVKDVKRLDMEVTIQVAGSQLPVVWRFNQQNGHLTQTEKIPSNREITIIAKGSGEASVTVVTEYYAKAKDRNTDCKNFELELMFEKENRVTYSGASESYKLTINTRYLSAERDATMSILDMSLLTGFVVDENDLKALSTGHGRLIQKFEMNKQLSDRGSLIIYLDRFSLDIYMHVEFFKAVLLNEDEDVSTVYYRMRIETSLKNGPEKDVVGHKRTFTVQLSCKEALDLKKGTGYLIMGHAEDVQLDGGNGQYALGERTWLEHWPSKDESNTTPELKEKYNGMLSLQHDLLFGCPKP
ncbi:Complement C3 [Triplophysa tibetana]|uniref:Complement C3 n=1 Tax=Triplophysa tibetana TaxID=1572043 RepID=A0A5A9PJ20_9TELE|nr:Complement C3 [Triplophysa tibetana]